MSLFFFDFWVALSSPRDGLICNPSTPAQSKHTFSVLHFFWKIAPSGLHFGYILGATFFKKLNCEWKMCSKNRFKKRVPPIGKQGNMTMARGSLTAPLACAVFWTRNKCLSKKQEQVLISESISEPLSWNGLFFESMSGKSLTFWWNLKQKKRSNCRSFCSVYLFLSWWSDTPWAKARRI